MAHPHNATGTASDGPNTPPHSPKREINPRTRTPRSTGGHPRVRAALQSPRSTREVPEPHITPTTRQNTRSQRGTGATAWRLEHRHASTAPPDEKTTRPSRSGRPRTPPCPHATVFRVRGCSCPSLSRCDDTTSAIDSRRCCRFNSRPGYTSPRRSSPLRNHYASESRRWSGLLRTRCRIARSR